MSGPVYIAKISHGFDWCEWLCSACAERLRKERGWTIKLGDIVVFSCDRCSQ